MFYGGRAHSLFPQADEYMVHVERTVLAVYRSARSVSGSRLFFFSSDRGEPVHVHVTRERKTAKFWLGPVRLEHNHGFSTNELTKIEGIVRANEAHLVQAWHDYFKSGK